MKIHCAALVPLMAAILAAIGIAFTVMRSMGIRFSGILLVAIAVVLMLLWLLWRWGKKKRAGKVAFGIVLFLFLAGTAVFGCLEMQILSGAGSSDAPADAVIVLGAGVRGTEPSPVLRTRVEAAGDYLAAHPDIPAVLSGGQGEGEDISEAECMYRYLTDYGIEPDRLLLEDQSTNTNENFRYSAAVLREYGIDPENAAVAVVSNDFHLYRAMILARRAGLNPIPVGASIPWKYLEINYTVREAFALAKTYLT